MSATLSVLFGISQRKSGREATASLTNMKHYNSGIRNMQMADSTIFEVQHMENMAILSGFSVATVKHDQNQVRKLRT